MNYLIKLLFKSILACSIVTIYSCSNQVQQSVGSENNASTVVSDKEVDVFFNLDDIVSLGKEVHSIKTNQLLIVNTSSENKWRVNVGRKYQSDIKFNRDSKRVLLSMAFKKPGIYPITVESVSKGSGQMANIQKINLSFEVE